MATTYTNRFRLNKPDFRTSPWSDALNENTDRLDSIIYNALQANNISTYENDVDVEAGQIMYDPELETFWICRVSHTTEPTGNFQDERDANPTYWTSVQFGLNPRGQWQQNTAYAYYDLAYDANENVSGLCLVPHTSPNTGTMRDEADKWVFIIDIQAGGGISATDVVFDDSNVPFTAANVQVAIDETNVRLDNAATIVSTHETRLDAIEPDLTDVIADVSALDATVTAQAATITGHTTDIAARATTARVISAAGLATGGGSLAADRTITVTASTNAQALAGTDDTTAMTPVRTKEAIVQATSAIVNEGLISAVFYSTSQTITIPANATRAIVRLYGATGGGAGGKSGYNPASGGGAGALLKYLTGLTPGSTLALTIGAAGTAGASTPTNGGAGGNTVLDSGTQTITTLTANGGGGGTTGVVDTSAGTPGSGGTATNGDINVPGLRGGFAGWLGGMSGFGFSKGGDAPPASTVSAGGAGIVGGCYIEWYR